MNKKQKYLATDLVVSAMMKLDASGGERHNVVKFMQSCYGGRVRSYDYDAAQQSLARLTDAEQHALTEYVLRYC